MAVYDVIAYVTRVGNKSTFLLKFVSCVIIWYKNVPLEASMESFTGEQLLWKFALYFNQCVLQENSIFENIFIDIFSSKFYQKYYYIQML